MNGVDSQGLLGVESEEMHTSGQICTPRHRQPWLLGIRGNTLDTLDMEADGRPFFLPQKRKQRTYVSYHYLITMRFGVTLVLTT